MIAFDLNKIRKPYFGYEEIAKIRGISLASAKVAASRYTKQGLLLRLKKTCMSCGRCGRQQAKKRSFDWQIWVNRPPTFRF